MPLKLGIYLYNVVENISQKYQLRLTQYNI